MVLRIAAFVAVWTLYFAISENASAIHNDMAEAYAWGREFQLGYNQHPPFWAWLCGLWFLIFPRANWAFALLAMLNAGVGLGGAWALIGRFAQGDKRVAAFALLGLTPFYSFLAYKYNANAIFLSLWPWTLYAFLAALESRTLRASLGFGVMMGLALNSKYFSGVLGATCFFAALASRERGRYFRSLSPYVSVAVALTLFAPHLWWLATTGAPPVRYLARVSGRGFAESAGFAALAVLGSLAQQALVFGFVAAGGRGRGDAERSRVLSTLVLAPIVLSVAAALALRTKLSSNMLIGVFPLAPLYAIELVRPDLAWLRKWSWRGAIVLALGALALSPLIGLLKSWYGRDAEDVEPRREAALAATEVWRRATDAPLAFVAGSFRYDNATVFYSPGHPSAFVNFDISGNRWAAPEAVRARGLLTICLKGDSVCLEQTARFSNSSALREEMTLIHTPYGRSRKPFAFVVTAIPPA